MHERDKLVSSIYGCTHEIRRSVLLAADGLVLADSNDCLGPQHACVALLCFRVRLEFAPEVVVELDEVGLRLRHVGIACGVSEV